MRTEKFGWKPDMPDIRDLSFKKLLPRVAVSAPSKIDLRMEMPAPYDQGQLGSCTANAIAGALQYDRMKLALPNFTPSRLFVYFNERVIEHTVKEDAGAQIRDGIKSVGTQGAPPEEMWPYDISAFSTPPSAAAVAEAIKHPGLQYARVDSTKTAIKQCLASFFPVIFGFTVYESFESQKVADSGVVPTPKSGEQPIGGHAVLCVGYNSTKIICRNSWGDQWGQKGYFTMPWAYITNTNLADDLWVIKGTK